MPSRPLRRAQANNSSLKPELGRPIGRYVARFRAGLTCKPQSGRRLFVKVFRSDTVNQQIAYSFPLGTFEITHTVCKHQVIEVPFENFGEIDDYISVQVSELNIDPKARPQRRGGKQFPDSTKKAFVWVDWLEVEGPFIEQWPPMAWTQTFFKGIPDSQSKDASASRGASNTLNDKKTAASVSTLTSTSESVYAREIIERFAFRAFRRRKPTKEYVDKVHAIFVDYRSSGSAFVDSIKESLAVVLASPSFVYLIERPASKDKTHRQLSDLELASRLSYFLWSQPPDEQLFGLAEEHKLSRPSVLREQIERMLDDPKAAMFVESFTSQWLDLPWLEMIVVNKSRYPDFNEELRRAFREESVQFIGTLIRSNLSAKNLIDSDFVVVNDVLAQFYGLDNGIEPPGSSRRVDKAKSSINALTITSSGFRRVNLPDDSPRGGLLGQGAILTMTSTGERTSPVERGVFVYERLLGRSVPPPPPNVPQLVISSEKTLTIRETLNAHIAKAQCASCHRRMDPLGFALEHFDGIGKWRERETIFKPSTELTAKGRPRRSKTERRDIDATGVMPDGKRHFDGHHELKQHLLADADDLAKGLARSMLTYALGRRVGFADDEFVDQMQADWKKGDYRMRSLIHAIVQSKEFQSK